MDRFSKFFFSPESCVNVECHDILIFFTAASNYDTELIVFGGCDETKDQKYKFKEDSVCDIKAKFPNNIENFVSDGVFRTAWACGGNECANSCK